MILTRRLCLALPAALPFAAAGPALAAPAIGQLAPDFTGTDSNGATVRLADLRGKVVVLEWTNDGCPFVRKWYNSDAMQTLQREAAAGGAVWLSIISSPPGEQGHADGPRANELTRTRKAAPAHVLLDPRGAIGRIYGAEVTPHMFIITAAGELAYMGGADSIATNKVEDLPKATPYARNALQAVLANRKVENAVTRPYGCTVKYVS